MDEEEIQENVYFEIPDWVENEEIEDYIAENHEQFSEAIDFTADYHDDRSVVDEIRIEAVKITGDSVVIEYEVDYSAQHACSDRSYAKTHYRILRGEFEGRTLVFDKITYPEQRTTHEEF